jgi:hypothetical protein
MKSKLLSNIEGRREWAVIFDPDDEVMVGFKQFDDLSTPDHVQKSWKPLLASYAPMPSCRGRPSPSWLLGFLAGRQTD